MLFHYDLHVFDNKKYRQTGTSGNRINPIPNHQIFNPQQLDTDQWIKVIKKAGFKFALSLRYPRNRICLIPIRSKSLQCQNPKMERWQRRIVGILSIRVENTVYSPVSIWESGGILFLVYMILKSMEPVSFKRNVRPITNQMVEGMVTETLHPIRPLIRNMV